MKLEDQRDSDNVEDRRGSGVGIGGGIGLGTVALAVAAYFLGIDPSVVLEGAQLVESVQQQSRAPAQADPHAPKDAGRAFVGKVLASTEDAWATIFERSGGTYRRPKLVLFTGAVETACGHGQAATGPFYCPPDEKVYIDLAFYEQLRSRFRAPGDFAQAYVIAHEVGHHVQKLLGTSDKVDRLRSRVSESEFNKVSVRLELQADCYAGVWGHYARDFKGIVEPGDVEEALTAAAAIGDDRLQRESRGRVAPESFTHGTSEQRARWFRRGMDTGDPKACDTFSRGAP